MPLFNSIISCFGTRFTVVTLPDARRYRVHPLGTFHYFDWQKTDDIGISIGTCPQIVSSETAQIGIKVGKTRRILPFDAGDSFSQMDQSITPLTTHIKAGDNALPVTAEFVFRAAFYPQNFEWSGVPGYALEIHIHNPGTEPVQGEAFFGLPLPDAERHLLGLRSVMPLVFPDGIDHQGIEGLTFEQVLTTKSDDFTVRDDEAISTLHVSFALNAGDNTTISFYHSGYIAEPSLNVRGEVRRFGYTGVWDNAIHVTRWWDENQTEIVRKGQLFEDTVIAAGIPQTLKDLLSGAFKGVAANAWWAEKDWFSVMEIGAYHSTLDVDYQMALFFFQYWPDLIKTMLDQWADFYKPGSGYMAHDVGQHLEATGNRYGGPESAMKVEENCNYILLLHHYWRLTGDATILDNKHTLVKELVQFMIDADISGSGLPNTFTDNTNDWGSALITASEEQSYHGVRMVAAFQAVVSLADVWDDKALGLVCETQAEKIIDSLAKHWLGDHYPISLSDRETYHHYSMWTTHGLLYPLREGRALKLGLDINKLRTDLISSTARTLREHGSVHSTADVRGWLTQNLWRDCIAAYLGIDPTDRLGRYLGHGEYVSYEDTTILEVANELMVVPGAVADHTYAGQRHHNPMVDGHPRPACGFGMLYALAGLKYDAIDKEMTFHPVLFPLKIALTHLADWKNEIVPWLKLTRSIPNQDRGVAPVSVTWEITNHGTLLEELEVMLKP